MIRVCHIGTESRWRGGENQINLLALGLKQRGVDSVIAYPKDSPALKRFELNFKCLGLAFSDSSAWIDLVSFVQENQIQILNAHSSAAHQLALKVKEKIPSLKIVVHRRVTTGPRWNPFRKRKYQNQNVDQFIAISNCIARKLEAMGAPKQKITRIYDGVDVDAFAGLNRSNLRTQLLQRINANSDARIIGVVAAFTKEKGHSLVLDAAARLGARSNLHILFAGTGPLEESLKTKTKSLGLLANVHFLGEVEKLSPILGSLDALVLPSSSEGLGTVLLEATAAGCPVIGSNVGGIPEFIHHQSTGLLFPKGDPVALGEALQRIVDPNGLGMRLQKNALALLRAQFSADIMCSETLKTYQKLFL